MTDKLVKIVIPLSRGLVAVIDTEDFARVSKHKWHAKPSGGHTFYAQTRKDGCGKEDEFETYTWEMAMDSLT